MAAKGRSRKTSRRDSPSRLTPPWSGSHASLIRAGLLALGVWLILAALYPEPMFSGRVFGSADAGNADAFAAVGDEALRAGDYPLWNPYLFAGMPTFGSLAYVKYLYPPAAVFNFLQQKLSFPPLTWLLGHMFFGGLGMVWLLSRWRLPAAALLLGAAAFLLFPKVVAWGVHGHGTKLGAAMYLPWLVGWTLRVLEGGGARAVGMVGLLLGLQLLRGHVQISYYTLLTLGWLGMWNAIWPLDQALRQAARAVRWRRLGLVAAGLSLGFMIGAALLVPVHQYAGISIRGQDTAGGGGVGLDYATGWALHPSELGSFVFPAAAGFGQATYLGHMPFNDYPNYFGLLLLALVVSAWSRENRSLVLALLALATLALLVAFGDAFFLYELLYRFLPFFNKFRIPSMILILPAFAAAWLAARGAARWARDDSLPARPRMLPLTLAALGAVMLLAGGAELGRGAYRAALTSLAEAAGRQPVPLLLDEAWQLQRSSLIRSGLILLTGGAAFWAALRNPGFRRHGLIWALLLLVGLDLLGVDRLITHPERGLQQIGRTTTGQGRLLPAGPLLREHRPGAARTSGPAAAAVVDAVGHDRIWPLGRWGGQNAWMPDGIRSLGGYHPAKLARYETIRQRLFGEQPACRIAAWLAGRVVAFERPFAPQELAALSTLGCELESLSASDGELSLYRLSSALPRARLVTAWRASSTLADGGDLVAFLDAVQAGEIDVATTVHLDATPDPAPQTGAGPLPAPVFETDGLNEIVLRTEAPVPTVLVLADMMAPGWRVKIDGRDASLLTADLVLRAVAVPAGGHTVRFVYADPAVRTGLILSTAGALLVAGLLLVPLLRRRREAMVVPDARAGAAER